MSQMPTIAGSKVAWSQEQGTQCTSATCVSGTQLLEPELLPCTVCLSGKLESEAETESEVGILMLDSGILTSMLTARPNVQRSYVNILDVCLT